MQNYEINSSTLALFPINSKQTKVLEKEREFIIDKSCLKIIDESCKYFGSSFKGREEGSKSLIGSAYKAPIIIEESRKLIFIPTTSPKVIDCNWISFQELESYEKLVNKVKINFKNGIETYLEISFYTFENQYFRALKLENTLRNRIVL